MESEIQLKLRKSATLNWVFLLILFMPLCIFPDTVGAEPQAPEAFFSEDAPDKPWHLTADEIQYDANEDVYIGDGGVIVSKNDRKILADRIRFDHREMTVLAQGNVMMAVGENLLTGSRMEMDLREETGTIYQGSVFLQENHFYINGEQIQKTGKNTYRVDRATVSTCDGDRPAWKITGRDLDVTIEGFGTVRNATLWANRVPVMWTPYMIFPVKLQRQSGLLAPQFGYDESKGFEFVQPFFWAVNRSSDATFYAHHMGDRGEKFGVEYRYAPAEATQGAVMFDFFNDRQQDDGIGNNSEKWGYADDTALRPNNDRYWFRMKHDSRLPKEIALRMDLDIVSDQDYLHEFFSGYSGYYDTKKYFSDTFSRELDTFEDPVRLNRIGVSKTWNLWSLNAETRWLDNVILRRKDGVDPTVQKLPTLRLNGTKQRIFGSPFYFDMESEYTYFYRQDGDKGHRIDAYPRFYLPLQYQHYFSIEPSVGLRETAWIVNWENLDRNDAPHRQIYDLTLDLSSEFFRIYDQGREKIKHSLRPQILYQYVPDERQRDLPLFDDLDRIEPMNLITYGLINTFTKKTVPEPSDRQTQNPDPLYRQICWFKVYQSYDIDKADADDPEPFSPITAELQYSPSKSWFFEADVQWSTYSKKFDQHNLSGRWDDVKGNSVFAEYRFNRDINESIYLDAEIRVSDRWTFYTALERNLRQDKNIRSGIGVIYQSQCWAIDIAAMEEDDDFRIEFKINLLGLGTLG